MKKLLIGLALLLVSLNVHAAPAIIIGVVAGAGAFAVGTTVATAIAIGMAAASFYLAKSNKPPGVAKSQQELKQLLRSSRAPKQVTYGEILRSGNLIFAEEQVGDSENDDGTFNEWLYMAVGIAGHPIHSIEAIYLNETPINDFGSNVNYTLKNNPTTADSYLLTNAPSWQADMIGRGTAWLRLALLFDREKFANGVPTPRIKFKGRNGIWDPRTGNSIYTNNAALVIADYFINYRGYTRDRIITSGFGSFIDAANLCDELVTNPDSTVSKRYTINGTFDMNEKPGQVLDDMLAACGGQLVRIGGKIGLLPAAYYGPSSITITESDISDKSDIQIQPEPAYSDSVNTMKGTFIDPSQNYVETDYPTVRDSNAIQRDGGELARDLNFRFVTDPYQAQRLANIELKRSLTGGSVQLTTNLKGLYARLGRTVNLDIKSMGLSGEYRVTSQSAHLSEGVELNLVREDIDIYDDAIGKPFVPPPLTNLPRGVASPSNVQFILESVGDIVQGVVRWQINDPQSSGTEIRIKNASDEVVQVGTSSRNTYNVNGLIAGNYTVEVRTVTVRSGVSSWSSALIVLGTPPEVDTVTVNRSNWNIEMIPNVDAGIPVGTLFEFWYLADNASYISDPPTYDENDRLLAEKIDLGSSLNHGGRTPDRWHHYWIRSVNSYGQSGFYYIQTGTTREQGLVTTVLERLVAIEIESQNYDDLAKTGYKLFSPASDPYTLPDGTVLDNPDGLAIFNNVIARGGLYGDYGEMNNVTINENCTVLGTIQANQIVGDIAGAITKSNNPVSVQNQGTSWVATARFGYVDVVTARPWIRTLSVTVNLQLDEITAEAYSAGSGKVALTGDFGTVESREIIIHPRENSSAPRSRLNVDITLSIQVPANTTGRMNVYGYARRYTRSRTFKVQTTVQAASTNNLWSTLVLSNSKDLG